MTKYEKLLASLLCAAIIGLVLVGLSGQNKGNYGGLVHNVAESFDAGIKVAGTQVINSAGAFIGAIAGTNGTLSGTLAVTGATTLSGTLGVTGTTTLADATVLQTTSSTLRVGGLNNIGCLAIGSSGSTTTINYITANAGTITSTTTKPAACK